MDWFWWDGCPGGAPGGQVAPWALGLTRFVTAPILWARIKTRPERRKPAPNSKSMVIVSDLIASNVEGWIIGGEPQ